MCRKMIARIAPTFHGRGLADGAPGLFSFLAMIRVYRSRPAGRPLGLLVAAHRIAVGAGLFRVTAPAERGRANAAVEALLDEARGLAKLPRRHLPGDRCASW